MPDQTTDQTEAQAAQFNACDRRFRARLTALRAMIDAMLDPDAESVMMDDVVMGMKHAMDALSEAAQGIKEDYREASQLADTIAAARRAELQARMDWFDTCTELPAHTIGGAAPAPFSPLPHELAR